MAKPMESCIEKKLLTCVAEIGPQPVDCLMEKKAQNKKVGTQWNANQWQGWRAKMGLKKIIKWLKQRKLK